MGEFMLLMSDHIFDPRHLRTLLAEDARPESGGAVLAVDYDIGRVFDLEDATLVRTDGRRQILDIGKRIEVYDAVDTGAFRCTRGLFEALETSSLRYGDCSLTDGIRSLAVSGKMRARDMGDLWWLDVDTPEALALAERMLSISRTEVEVGSSR
jgi:choline kinase